MSGNGRDREYLAHDSSGRAGVKRKHPDHDEPHSLPSRDQGGNVGYRGADGQDEPFRQPDLQRDLTQRQRQAHFRRPSVSTRTQAPEGRRHAAAHDDEPTRLTAKGSSSRAALQSPARSERGGNTRPGPESSVYRPPSDVNDTRARGNDHSRYSASDRYARREEDRRESRTMHGDTSRRPLADRQSSRERLRHARSPEYRPTRRDQRSEDDFVPSRHDRNRRYSPEADDFTTRLSSARVVSETVYRTRERSYDDRSPPRASTRLETRRDTRRSIPTTSPNGRRPSPRRDSVHRNSGPSRNGLEAPDRSSTIRYANDRPERRYESSTRDPRGPDSRRFAQSVTRRDDLDRRQSSALDDHRPERRNDSHTLNSRYGDAPYVAGKTRSPTSDDRRRFRSPSPAMHNGRRGTQYSTRETSPGRRPLPSRYRSPSTERSDLIHHRRSRSRSRNSLARTLPASSISPPRDSRAYVTSERQRTARIGEERSRHTHQDSDRFSDIARKSRFDRRDARQDDYDARESNTLRNSNRESRDLRNVEDKSDNRRPIDEDHFSGDRSSRSTGPNRQTPTSSGAMQESKVTATPVGFKLVNRKSDIARATKSVLDHEISSPDKDKTRNHGGEEIGAQNMLPGRRSHSGREQRDSPESSAAAEARTRPMNESTSRPDSGMIGTEVDISPRVLEAPTSGDSSIYERIGQVGEGTYGKVYKARHRLTNEFVALKRIRMEQERDGFPITSVREIKLLQRLRHPGVVKLLEMMIEKGSVYMVFEYMDHDLTGVLANQNITFEPPHIKDLAAQLFEGLAYLHHRGVLHRDIKASNILLNNAGQLKLADFGLARFYQKSRLTADYTNRVITLWFRPPELLLGATAYDAAVDIWSAGCILIELFTKSSIFPGRDEIHQLETIYQVMGSPTTDNWPGVSQLPWFELIKFNTFPGKFDATYRDVLTPAALDLGGQILRLDPTGRPNASEILKHDYFQLEEPRAQRRTLFDISESHEWDTKQRRRDERAKRNKMEKEAAARETASG